MMLDLKQISKIYLAYGKTDLKNNDGLTKVFASDFELDLYTKNFTFTL